jgi:hypothetical protein
MRIHVGSWDLSYHTVGENNLGAPKIRNIFCAFLLHIFRFTWYCTNMELHTIFLNWIRGRRVRVFIPIISTKGNNSDKERKIVRKKLSFMHKKRFNIFQKMGAIPRLPYFSIFY